MKWLLESVFLVCIVCGLVLEPSDASTTPTAPPATAPAATAAQQATAAPAASAAPVNNGGITHGSGNGGGDGSGAHGVTPGLFHVFLGLILVMVTYLQERF